MDGMDILDILDRVSRAEGQKMGLASSWVHSPLNSPSRSPSYKNAQNTSAGLFRYVMTEKSGRRAIGPFLCDYDGFFRR